MDTTHIDDLIARLQPRLAALGDGRDAASDNERAAYWRSYAAIQTTLTGLQNIACGYAKPQAQLAAVELQRAEVLAKRAELEAALAAAPALAGIRDGRERDREAQRQDGLRTSLRLLHEGRLWASPGVTYPALEHLDARVAELNQKIETLRANHDALLEAAEALLAEAVST